MLPLARNRALPLPGSPPCVAPAGARAAPRDRVARGPGTARVTENAVEPRPATSASIGWETALCGLWAAGAPCPVRSDALREDHPAQEPAMTGPRLAARLRKARPQATSCSSDGQHRSPMPSSRPRSHAPVELLLAKRINRSRSERPSSAQRADTWSGRRGSRPSMFQTQADTSTGIDGVARPHVSHYVRRSADLGAEREQPGAVRS